MNADFCYAAFDVVGIATIVMDDGRQFNSEFPTAVWRWLQDRNWVSVSVYDADTQQWYGWDRF